MLRLGNPVASGRFRDVYIHPEDDGKLIKIERPVTPASAGTPIARAASARRAIKAKLWSADHPTAHERELRGIDRLRRKSLLNHPYLVGYFGEVETEKGRGLIFERIRNFYYDDVKTIADYLTKNRRLPSDTFKAKLAKYFDFLADHDLYIAGGEKENIAIISAGSGDLAVKAFDVKIYPDRRLVPLGFHRWISQRQIERQRQRILGA